MLSLWLYYCCWRMELALAGDVPYAHVYSFIYLLSILMIPLSKIYCVMMIFFGDVFQHAASNYKGHRAFRWLTYWCERVPEPGYSTTFFRYRILAKNHRIVIFEVKWQEYWFFFFLLGIISNMIKLPTVALETDLLWYRKRYNDIEVGL